MSRKPFDASKIPALSAATTAQWDFLVVGTWIDTDEVVRVGAEAMVEFDRAGALDVGRRLCAKTLSRGAALSDDVLIGRGARDVSRNNLMISCRSHRVERCPETNRHRMAADFVAEWGAARETHGAPVTQVVPAPPVTPVSQAATPVAVVTPAKTTRATSRKPPIFGGVPESSGWVNAPLVARDRVHFRTDRELPLATFRGELPTGTTVSLDEGEGLYRVEGVLGQGDHLATTIKSWCKMHGFRTVGLRSEPAVRRRETGSLDPQFLTDLCQHYGLASRGILQRHMSTIKIHIADQDDLNQQFAEWVLMAVTRFDDTKNVPFGAFLAGQICRWVHDLNRNKIGRCNTDIENAQQKAIAAFTVANHRRPTETELAHHMRQPLDVLRRNAQTVATLQDLRNAYSLDFAAEQTEIPLADTHGTPDDLMCEVDQALLSQALTASCAADTTARGTAKPNVLGWATMYFSLWGGMTKTELSEKMETSMRNMTLHANRAQDELRTRLVAAEFSG